MPGPLIIEAPVISFQRLNTASGSPLPQARRLERS